MVDLHKSYNIIKEIIENLDHRVILNADDPMCECLEKFHPVVKNPGDPTNELLAKVLYDSLKAKCVILSSGVKVTKIRESESPSGYAEYTK